ncbi:MAG: hypothetical protein ABIO85_02325 [Sphingomicrobium sp.]
MNLRFIDWIWSVRGSLALAPGQSSEDAFGRLEPLFRQPGTSHERTNNTLTFRKKDQAAQDRMSIFDGGVLQIENGPAEPELHYHLTSRILLACFMAPLLFLGIAQLTIAIGKLEEPKSKSAKAADAAKKAEVKKAQLPMNPLDKMLGAPAPEKKKKDGKEKDEDKKFSPTPAYVFASIFATLYVVGRILEDWLVRALFRKRMLGI